MRTDDHAPEPRSRALTAPDPPTAADRRVDVTWPLTIFLFLLLALPTSMVVEALGFIGGPAIVFGLIIFFVGVLLMLSRSAPQDPGPTMVEKALLVLLFVNLVSYAGSAWLPLPIDERSVADGALLTLVSMVAVSYAAARIRDRDRLWALMRAFSTIVGLLGLLAVIQMATGQQLVDKLSIPGLSAPVVEVLQARGLGIRPSGTSTHPLEFAAIIVMALPILLVVAETAKRHRSRYITIAVVASLIVLTSGSRTSIVCGLVAFVAMMPAWTARVRLMAVGALVAATAVVFVAVPGFIGSISRLFSGAGDDPSISSRTESYDIVLRYWSTHPWIGRGPGTFQPKYWILDNQYLQTLIGGGVVGLLAFLAVVITAVVAASRAVRRAESPADRKLAIAVRASVLAGSLSFAMFDVMSFPQTAGVFFFMVGLSGAVLKVTSRSDVPEPSPAT